MAYEQIVGENPLCTATYVEYVLYMYNTKLTELTSNRNTYILEKAQRSHDKNRDNLIE